MKIRINTVLIDKVGISASVLCAIHCAVVPLLITFLPIWGLGFLANEFAEAFMIGLSLVVALFTLLTSYKKHKSPLPAFVLVCGFGMISVGHYVDQVEDLMVPIGGLAIALAHLLNIKLTKNCAIYPHLKKKT